jgi:hypothetical protein
MSAIEMGAILIDKTILSKYAGSQAQISFRLSQNRKEWGAGGENIANSYFEVFVPRRPHSKVGPDEFLGGVLTASFCRF